jgi:alpha-amylase/alpha-mannosidase (GH57 family)
MGALLRRLPKRLAHILDAIAPFVVIVVGGLGVGEKEDEATAGPAFLEQLERVANGRSDACVARGRNGMEARQTWTAW